MPNYLYWRQRADAHREISAPEMQAIETRLNEYRAKRDYYVQSAQEGFEIARLLFTEVERFRALVNDLQSGHSVETKES